jgi:hypothetical protein
MAEVGVVVSAMEYISRLEVHMGLCEDSWEKVLCCE